MTQLYSWELRGLLARAAWLLALLPWVTLAQTPAATFALQATAPSTGANSYPTSVAIADVNGDGRPNALTAVLCSGPFPCTILAATA